MVALDVEKAFGYMQHGAVAQHLMKRGWGAEGTHTLMKHLNLMESQPDIAGLPPMGSISYRLGGRQGCADTAVVFADMMEALLEEDAQTWHQSILGSMWMGKY